ncbi:MAG: FtsX-like permease family protein [Candidatus Heimdallarchaeota archaeon]
MEMQVAAIFGFDVLGAIKIDEDSWLSLHSVILTCLAFLSLFVLLEWRKRSQESPQLATAVPWRKVPHGRMLLTSVLLGAISVLLWVLTVYFAGGWRLEFFAIFVGFSCGLGAVWSGAARSKQSANVVKGVTFILAILGGAITFLWQALPTSVSFSELRTNYPDYVVSFFFLILFTIIGLFWAHEVVMSSNPSTYSWHDFLRYLIPTITYTLSGLWRHKRRSINFIIVIIFSVAMVTTLAIWLDEAPEVAIERALDERDYHFEVRRQAFATGQVGNPRILRQIENYLLSFESVVDETELVYNTHALFNVKNKTDNYLLNYVQNDLYNISADQIYMTRVVPNQMAQVVSEQFMSRIKRQLRLVELPPDGSYEFGGNKVLMSQNLQRHINESIGLEIHAGDIINMSVTHNDLNGEIGTPGLVLSYLNPLNLNNVEIAGIFERIPTRRITYSTFNEETLGDGLYISKELVGQDYVDEIEWGLVTDTSFALIFPKLFVRLDKDVVANIGWRSIESEMNGLENRIRAQGTAQWFASVFFEMDEVYDAIELYRETRWVIVFLLVPIVALSVLLATMTVGILNKSRKSEIQILRTRGADSVQVVSSVILEMTLLGSLAIRIGMVIGMILAATIAPTRRFLEPNVSNVHEALLLFPEAQIKMLVWDLLTGSDEFTLQEIMLLPSDSWFNTVIIFGLILLIGLITQSYFQIRSLLLFPTSKDSRSGVNPFVAFISDRNLDLIMLLIGFPALFWLVDSDILARTFSDQEFLALHLSFAVLLWLGFAAVTSRVMALIIAKAEKILQKLFSASSFVIITNLKRRQHLISMLAFLATVTFSIGIFASIYNETMWTNTEDQARFVIGSDYKVLTRRVSTSMSTNFSSIPGINEALAMPISSGELGDGFVALIGVNASQYSKMAYWDDSAFDEDKNRVTYYGDNGGYYGDLAGERRGYQDILGDLENSPNGIIVNEALADDLRLEVGDIFQLANVNPLNPTAREDYFEIVGIGYSAPGFGILSQFLEVPFGATTTRSLGAALVNSQFLADRGVDSASTFLLEAASDSNEEEVVSAIRSHESVQAVYYLSYFDIEGEGFLALGGVPGILTIDFIGSLAIIAFSLGAFLEYIIRERRQEYALLRAVGATKGQVSKSVVGEFLGIAVVSLAIGGIVSLIFSLAFLELSVGHLTIFSVLPYSIFIPLPTIALTVFLVFVFLMMGSLWPSRRAGQTQIADVLRNL